MTRKGLIIGFGIAVIIFIILSICSCSNTYIEDPRYFVVSRIGTSLTEGKCLYEDDMNQVIYKLPCGMYQIGDTIKPPVR